MVLPLFYSAENKHSQVHCVAGNRQKMCASYMTTTATQCEYKKAAFKKLHNFYTPEMKREKTSGVFFFIAERGELIKVIYIL
jgi:hypothetical protein